jgi:tetratricopeptide (TPR) repeat protein
LSAIRYQIHCPLGENVTEHRSKDDTTPGTGGERAVTSGRDVSGSLIVTGNNNIIENSPTARIVATALHQLRAAVGDFVGRELEIKTLVNALDRSSHACIAGISGMSGTGKTELALFVAAQVSCHYSDAQLFIDLEGTDANPRPASEVLATCIRAFLGREEKLPEDLNQLLQVYLSQLSGKRVLLLLDNAGDTAQVLPLLTPPGSALLVTSRHAIALPGMMALQLTPFSDIEARQLLLQIAPRAERAADQICDLCGYLPLAIRSAGTLLAITPDLDPIEYAAELRDERNRLERIGAEGVKIGVEASLNLSYVRLAPEAARVFLLLSVFPGTFDAAAEEVICTDTGHAQLSKLVQRGLVFYDSSTNRYHLHNLTRLFAEARWDEEQERPQTQNLYATPSNDANRDNENRAQKKLTQRKHAEYFLLKAEGVEQHLSETDIGTHMEWFKAEQDNMRSALSWSLENDAAIALRLAISLSTFWNILGQLNEEQRALNQALKTGADAPPELRMRVLRRAALRQSSAESAKEWAEIHLKLSRETGLRLEEARALQNLGSIAGSQGHFDEARTRLQDALTLFRQEQDRQGMAQTLLNLCVLALDQDDLVSAQTFVMESVELNEQLANRGELPVARIYLAFLRHKQGEREQADQLIGESLKMLREDARQSWLPWGLHWQGRIAIDRKEFNTARVALTESLTLFQKNQDTGGKIRSLLAFSWLSAAEGLWERAAILLAAEEFHRRQQQSAAASDWKREIEFIKTNSRVSLGESRFDKAWRVGEQMSLDQAVAYSIETT